MLKFFSSVSELGILGHRMIVNAMVNTQITIGTHDGVFHCDEALGCFLLTRLPDYRDAKIIRTRDPVKLSGCDLVLDVGGVFDAASHRYDHHQRVSECSDLMKSMRLITAFQLQTEYRNVGGKVKALNPTWNSEECPEQDALFSSAMKRVGDEFVSSVKFIAKTLKLSETQIQKAVSERKTTHPSGALMEITDDPVDAWKYFLADFENKLDVEGSIKFIIQKDVGRRCWKITTVPTELPHGGTQRVPFPSAWRGMRDEDFRTISGLKSALNVDFANRSAWCESREGDCDIIRSFNTVEMVFGENYFFADGVLEPCGMLSFFVNG
ncbi:unnamed protein product [Notodromas monacha]|uniref:Uncharacterized protein n=1 Tax=Notodromas monacha TaxID=399045 RepID=A0A7R9BR02_9CRUS|nr:unnamed protein product [Notodromas monacha]CAG0919201.1 unnamed protein product [Notodromas monacha]